MSLPHSFLSGKGGGAVVALYPFTAHTFTDAGQIGMYGPSQAQINSAYSGTQVYGYVTSASGIQEWIVPADGTYRITAAGASGKDGRNRPGGDGAIMRGDFTLVSDDVLRILVGQMGGAINASNGGGGGGGGTYVATNNNSPLIVAGAGGGGSYTPNGDAGMDGVMGTSGTPDSASISGGGVGGQGGSASSRGAGGAGFFGNGSAGSYSDTTYSFVNGGLGGGATSSYGTGGFGGGGAERHGGGGGGGYSGGGAGNNDEGGGGGGSYNDGSNQSNTSGANTGPGYVTIELI